MWLTHLTVLEFRSLRLGDSIWFVSDKGLLNEYFTLWQTTSHSNHVDKTVDKCVDETTWKERKQDNRESG